MRLDNQVRDLIKDKVKEIIDSKGLDLVDFKIFWNRRFWIVRVLADFPSGGITLEECSAVNRLIFSFIEKGSILKENFHIEVNSPGLDRPLREARDFLRAKEKLVSIWFKEAFKDKTYLEAVIKDVRNDMLLVEYKDQILEIPLGE